MEIVVEARGRLDFCIGITLPVTPSSDSHEKRQERSKATHTADNITVLKKPLWPKRCWRTRRAAEAVAVGTGLDRPRGVIACRSGPWRIIKDGAQLNVSAHPSSAALVYGIRLTQIELRLAVDLRMELT